MSYLIKHESKVFSPDGNATIDSAEIEKHNAEQEKLDLAHWATKPDRFYAYYTKSEESPNFGNVVVTWLGTRLGDVYYHKRSYMPNGTRILHIRVRGTNGAEYYGKFGDDNCQLVRLRRFR